MRLKLEINKHKICFKHVTITTGICNVSPCVNLKCVTPIQFEADTNVIGKLS